MKKINAKKTQKTKIRKRQGGGVLKPVVKKKLRGTTYQQPEYKVIPNTTFASDMIKKKRKPTGIGKRNTKEAEIKHKLLFKRILGNVGKGMSMGEAMQAEGYSKSYSENPKSLKSTDSWQKLMEKHLPESELARHHKELLTSTRLEHATFPPYNLEKAKKREAEGKEKKHGEQLTDDDIRDLFKDVNCTVRRIVHGELTRHVYFWSADNRARKDALDMAYKLNKKYGDTTIIHKFGGTSDEELEGELARELSEGLRDKTGANTKKGK